MTNEEVLEFVWVMTKISVIKPGSPRSTQWYRSSRVHQGSEHAREVLQHEAMGVFISKSGQKWRGDAIECRWCTRPFSQSP
jgi:hypothetical protein